MPDLYFVDPDSVAVIRPLRIVAIDSDLPPVTSGPEIEVSTIDGYEEHEEPALALRFISDGPPPLDTVAKLGGTDAPATRTEGPLTARDPQGKLGTSGRSSPNLPSSAIGSSEPTPQPPPKGAREKLGSQPSIEIEAEPIEEDDLDLHSIDGDMEPIEVEPERDSDASDEIPILVDEPESQPKKTPPPLPRRSLVSIPALPSAPSGSVPPLSAPDAPRQSITQPQPVAVTPPQPVAVTPPQPVAATPPQPIAATPPQAVSPIVARPLSDPAGPFSDAPKRKKPWWEELFGDDYIRTLDKIDPATIQHEVDFIEERLGVEKGAVILDLACGAGAHAVEMASRDYSVVGYDLSLAMLALAADEAQERGQKLNFLQGDMRDMAFEETFDAIYCWSTSFGYFDEEKNADVLHRIRRALRTGGMLLLDMVNRDYVTCRQPSLVWFEGDGCVCMDEMQVDFFASRLKVKRTVMFDDGRSRELDYSIRIYGLHELGKLLHEAGFKVIEVTGHPAHPGVFFGSESPRIIILAERS